jgi:pantetheine-phosphate adenylyltransferase
MKKIAVYPGSFDPITNGHIDLIERGLRCFDELIVLVGYNPVKTFLFTVEERVTMIKELVGENPRLKVDSYRGLIVDYVDKTDANVILRGLRAMSDFEYEFQMALINRKLHKSIETVFLMTGAQWFYVNSRIIKEAASMGGSVKGLVPENVLRRLKDKYPGFKNDS